MQQFNPITEGAIASNIHLLFSINYLFLAFENKCMKLSEL